MSRDKLSVLRTGLFLVSILGLLFSTKANAEKFLIKIDSSPHHWTVENTGLPEKPTIQIIGVTDTSVSPPKHTLNPAINGVQVAAKLLSDSILTIKPDGTGEWEYDTGFKSYRLHLRKKLAGVPEANKYKHDGLSGDYFSKEISGSHHCSQRLFLASGKARKAIYKIEFPDEVKIKKLRIWFSASDYGKTETGFPEIYTDLYKDSSCKERLSDRFTGSLERGEGTLLGRTPVVFKEIDRSVVYLCFSSNGKGFLNIYNLRFKAFLDTSKLNIPLLGTGINEMEYSDDENSSHRAKLKILWEQKPLESQIWDDFNGEKDGWKAFPEDLCKFNIVETSPHTGEKCGEIVFNISETSEELQCIRRRFVSDWTEYTKLFIVVKCNSDVHGQIMAVFYDLDKKKYNHFHLLVIDEKTNGWKQVTFDISKLPRKNVTFFQIYSYPTWRGWIPGQEVKIYVDSLAFRKPKGGQ